MADESKDQAVQGDTETSQDQSTEAKASEDTATDDQAAGGEQDGNLLIDAESDEDGQKAGGDDKAGDGDDDKGDDKSDGDKDGDEKPAKVEGVPETPDGYKIDVDPDIPQDEAVTRAFRQEAHDIGLTNEQLQRLSNFDAARMRDAMKRAAEQTRKEVQAAETKLRDKWGGDFEANKAAAALGYRRFGTTALDKLMNETKVAGPDGKKISLGSHPVLLEAFHRIGTAIDEDTFIPTEDTTPDMPRTLSGDPDLTADDD